MDEVKLRVEGRDVFWSRAMAVARRIDAGDYTPEAASLSFPTMDGFLQLVTPERWHLLRTLRRHGKVSVHSLAMALERDEQGVDADVAALLAVDLIVRDEAAHISVPWSKISAVMDLGQAA